MAVETAQTLERGVRLLYILAGNSDGLTVTELSRSLGVSRTIVYRLAVTLEANALLRRGTDGRYRLGLGVVAIARHVQSVLRDAALPTMRVLAVDAAATAFMAISDGDEVLVVAVAEPQAGLVHVARRVGHRSALRSSAAGLAILDHRARAPEAAQAPLGARQVPLAPGVFGAEIAVAVDVPGVEAAIGVLHLGLAPIAEVSARVVQAAADVAIGLR